MMLDEHQEKQWASAEGRIQANLMPASDAPGLGIGQIEGRWRWSHLKDGGTMFGGQPTVDGLPGMLRRHGYIESSITAGGCQRKRLPFFQRCWVCA